MTMGLQDLWHRHKAASCSQHGFLYLGNSQTNWLGLPLPFDGAEPPSEALSLIELL